MLHPYTYQEFQKERYKDMLKEAELNRMLQRKGSKQGSRDLVKMLVGKVEDFLVSASDRLSERHISPLGGRFKEA